MHTWKSSAIVVFCCRTAILPLCFHLSPYFIVVVNIFSSSSCSLSSAAYMEVYAKYRRNMNYC